MLLFFLLSRVLISNATRMSDYTGEDTAMLFTCFNTANLFQQLIITLN